MNRNLVLALGVAAVLAETAIWHAPLGAGERMAAKIEHTAKLTLEHYEMPLVTAKLERSPLRRRLLLSGPADDFQQGELVRMMNEIPGVSDVRWTNPPGVPAERVE